ncbi:hypothetical protein [Demequina sp. NBRC 110056]|uniref:hypothetical protein n=1 Tax=Demequina sp. NBRC 110056 TaxID=1570345 RepID=UPI000A046205|nr:hypothetical protein [Demequina sp. NBRC 110056]
MRGLRTLLSALCILAGTLLIAGWAVSSVVVRAVEDGTALRGITEHAMDSAAVRSEVAAQVTAQVLDALADAGITVGGTLIEQAVEGALDSAVASPAFRDAVLDEADAAHAQFADALADPARESAPLVLDVDVSGAVNARIDDIPAVGGAIPDVDVPLVGIEVMDAATFDSAREGYARVAWVAAWGLWVGLGLLALGIVVSHRRRWFVAKVLVLLGVICLAVGAAIALLGPETVATLVPGGRDGALGSLWHDVLADEAAPVVMERSFWIAGAALVGAAIAGLVASMAGGRRR